MKALKIIFAILLILLIIPVPGCSMYASSGVTSTEHKVSEDINLYVEYGQSCRDFLSDIHIIGISAEALTVFAFLGIISAVVIIFTTLRKRYGGLISSGIILAIIGWAQINKMLIYALENHRISLHLIAANIVYEEKDWVIPYAVFNSPNNYTTIQVLLALPAVGLLVVGLLQAFFPRKKKKETLAKTDVCEKGDSAEVQGSDSRSDDNFEQLKKYKILLDDGVITQEDFEAKKKQLLEL